MNIVIFGGSFNPPTLAHEAIITKALSLHEFDEVWVMPSTSRQDKQVSVSGDHRIAMLKCVKKGSFNNDPRLVISDYELTLPHNSEMYKTVLALEQSHPYDHFWFIFGGDSYDSIHTWGEAQWLIENMKVIVISDTPRATTTYSLSNEVTNISSTEVRRLAHKNQDISKLVSPAVADYIKQHSIY